MCGIAGILNVDPAERVSPRLLDRMVDALTHRGPDDRGVYIDGAAGIGMRRLSIVDLAGGHQPMSSPDGRVHVVYNGECYNHQDLRRELETHGHRFATHCDTEAVVHGYLRWGARGLAERMNGIYAFCVWDRESRTATIVRDRLGVKPLYFVHRNGRLAFSSELRSVAMSGLVQAKIDEVALWGYLGYQFTPTDRTLVSGVNKLSPGHLLTWKDGRIETSKYWEFPNQSPDESADYVERTEALSELLWDTVTRQMMADVPIGCFLSGGLDSTIIACMMAQRSSHAVRTFSIAFPGDEGCDESHYFERMARFIDADHQTINFSEKEVIDTLPEFAWAMDEPVADPAMLPTYLLSRAAGRELKVVLTGEGADEVFAGYPYYRRHVFGAPEFSSAQRHIESHDRLLFSRALRERLGVALTAPRNDELSAISGFPYALDARFIWNMLSADHRPDLSRLEAYRPGLERAAMADLPGVNRLQAALALDTKVWLAHDLMPKLDKMTMAHSLEGRVPFLDHRLIEFAFALPDEFKVGPEHGKMILRDAVRGVIPDWMLFRVKHGFNVPLYDWFRGSLAEFMRVSVLGTTLADTGLFNRPALEALVVAHRDLNINVARPLWELICLSRWYERLQRELAFADRTKASEAAPTEIGVGGVSPLEATSASAAPSVPGRALGPNDVAGRCDIIVPVYEGVNFVRDMLRSVKANTTDPYRVLLIDDSANDATFAELEKLAATDDRIELHRNDGNLGFVESCNRGLALARSEYVCLLNTDTLVGRDWLSRMVTCAESDAAIAIVNPLSNMCVNLSVPMPPGLNLNTMTQRIGALTRRRYPDITTAVGFCMLMKKRYVDWLGGFDPEYGRGYCEESDLCMRYTEAGLRVVMADDAFVYHKGCGSFGTWLERYQINRRIFDERWQEDYERDYRHFLKRNPMQYLRDALLRHTVCESNDAPAATRAMDTHGRLVPYAAMLRRGAPTANAAAAARAGLRTSRVVHERTDPFGALHALPRTELNPEVRAVRFPSRRYIDGLPDARGLRITFLVESMPVAGGITSIVQLAREMTLAGHDVKIVTEARELHPERFNLPCQPLVYPNRDELIRLFPPSDVVVATYWTTAHEYLPELRRRMDFVSVYFVQDYEVYFYPAHEVERRRQVGATFAMADYRIVKSQWLSDLIERNHGQPCLRVHLGLDLGIFRDRKPGDRLGRPPRIVSVARPNDRRRGFPEVVDVFHRIHNRRPEVEFVFFGTPDEEMPRDLPFPYTNMGRIYDLNKVAEMVSGCDIVVDSSLFQGFGRPGIEAMACGTASVLTNEGGVNEYARHEHNCLMVRPRQTSDMGDAIMRLLEDDALRNRLRRNGLATAREYCHIDEARQHMRLYQMWVERGRGSRASLASPRNRFDVEQHARELIAAGGEAGPTRAHQGMIGPDGEHE